MTWTVSETVKYFLLRLTEGLEVICDGCGSTLPGTHWFLETDKLSNNTGRDSKEIKALSILISILYFTPHTTEIGILCTNWEGPEKYEWQPNSKNFFLDKRISCLQGPVDSYVRWNFTFATRAGKFWGQKRSPVLKERPISSSSCEHQKSLWYSHSFYFKAYQPRIGRNMWKGSQRGGGLCMEIPCVYIFNGPRKHVDLLEQLLEVSNNSAIREEDDPGTACCKQTTSKRKMVKSNDSKKKPRKWNVRNRRQKTLLKDYTQYKSQTPEERHAVRNQICHATLLLFFLVKKCY